MNDQTYFFQSSIGKKIIFKETLKNFNESVKNFDWTDNKIYKLALNIDISTTFDESNKINENENLRKDFVKRALNEKTARESVIKVNLYYDSLSYELSTESPKMTLADLLASIGGNLGLFMGMSLMSFSEILEVLLEIIIIKLRI